MSRKDSRPLFSPSHNDHGPLLAAGEVQAGKLKHEVTGGLVGELWQSGIEFQQLTALGESVLLGSVGEKAEVKDGCKLRGPS